MRKGQIRMGIAERENALVKPFQDETASCREAPPRAQKHLIIAQIVSGAVSA